ncbi:MULTISPECIES: lactate utilization protein [Calditerrivibrio]|uniref:Lactate utilization protein C n=1 Tax=Calditerrivibrio nitroreducens TaxID=477976 RepID=A0A2J6WJK0_9BACT|nr:MAG: lactate utilization protein C [Calditerrivibrio nitroreducens]
MLEIKKWHNTTLAEKTIDSLLKNGFRASYYENSNTALTYIDTIISEYNVIGIGGSMTIIKDLKLLEREVMKNKIILNHNLPDITPEEKHEIRKKQQTSDLFITSSNAITEDGKLVNIDGVGNRVNAMLFGPKKTVIVAGINKIVKNVDDGINRIKRIASPMNARRLGVNTPCATLGYCTDCNSPQRICRVISIIEKRPIPSNIEIILIGENLGF